MRKLVFLLSLCSIVSFSAMAQHRTPPRPTPAEDDFNTAIGVRFNPFLIGFTIKHMFDGGPHSIEGIAATDVNRGGNFTMTALYEYNLKIVPDHKEWTLFFGGGVHLGIYDRWNFDHDRWVKHGDGSYATPGIDGIVGVSYTFKNLPINVSADLKPYANFSGPTKYMAEQMGGLSARYTF